MKITMVYGPFQSICILLCLVTVVISAKILTKRQYHSIIGDPGMEWKKKGNGPRMQLFFYNLCSKAGYSNMSVVPATTDTCSPIVPNTIIGFGSIEKVPETKDETCCSQCLKRPWCLAYTRRQASSTNNTLVMCDLKDNTIPQKNKNGPKYLSLLYGSATRLYHPKQTLPSPRYANCIVNGKQTIAEKDNTKYAGAVENKNLLDDEWLAVSKEHYLAEKCKKKYTKIRRNREETALEFSYFWTLMSQNGNAQSTLGTVDDCLPYCYINFNKTYPYPPAVNASTKRCPKNEHRDNKPPKGSMFATTKPSMLKFNNLPMNQAKVMTQFTDPNSSNLFGSFNWTFELDANLKVKEEDFPKNQSLGIWSWEWSPTLNKAIVRVYQRVSTLYPWICTYFGVDISQGVKGNQAYDGRGMIAEKVHVGQDFIVRFFLNITKNNVGSGGIGSWYLLNMEACWDQITGKNCRPYGNTNRNVHQQVLLDYGIGGGSCSKDSINGCPLFHILRNGTKVSRENKQHFPYNAYKQYCCPCTSCSECINVPCCDPMSNSNGQSIYKISPHPIWNAYGFPINSSDGFIGDAKMHELHVGKLWQQIWFPCMAKEPIEIITLNIGPETGLGTSTHDTEFFISDFDVLL